MTVEQLRARFGNVHDTRGVLAVLGDWAVERKRAELYPQLVKLLKGYLCGARKPPSRESLDAALRFLGREVAHEPELAAQLYAAIGGTPVQHAREELFDLIIAMRDRRGIPLLRGWGMLRNWADAVIALHAEELVDDLLATYGAGSRDFAVACGIVGGERARRVLTRTAKGDSASPIGLAFLANPDDRAYFDGLGGTPNQTIARRIYTLLTARGFKQRRDALEQLALGMAAGTEAVGVERLMACTFALADERPDIVEHAATVLAAHATAHKAKLRLVFAPAFLDRSARAVERGVTAGTRACFETVRAWIPHAPPLPPAKIVAAPPTRKAAAKAKGAAMLDAMRAVAPAGALHQRDPGIEAQLAAAPDDPAAYLVYADWLQSRGDPRGTWITLHTLKGLAAREALATFLAEHREAVLGPAAPVLGEARVVELDWYMGFVTTARFSSYGTASVLRALLDAPCGAVVQELRFADAHDREGVIAVLRERRPPALARLAFGAEDEPPPELVEVLPRLRRDPRRRWAEVLARIDKHRKVRVEIPVNEVPVLEPIAGVAIDVDMAKILLGLKLELRLEHAIGIVAAIPHLFTPTSVDRFARALVEAFRRFNDTDWARWGFDASGPLGGPETARYLGAQLGSLRSRERIADALGHLARIGTPIAIEEMAHAALAPSVDDRLRTEARPALAALAADREVDVETLIATAPPTREGRSLDVQRRWLEALLVDGGTLPIGAFRAGVLDDPIRLEAARTLLWAERAADGAIVGMFRVDERGAPVRRDGTPYVAKGRIGLVHPAELTESELAGARRAFAGVEQAVPQLGRPVFGLSTAEARGEELTRFVKRRVGFEPIATTLRARGWSALSDVSYDEDGERQWHGTAAFTRELPRDDVRVVAHLNSTRGSIALVRATRGAYACSFDELHVVTLSELLWDLEAAHGRAEPARLERVTAPPAPPPPQPSPPGPPPPSPVATTTAPVVERAKSGRSKCVVCTQAIAKDAWRVGVERMVETPTFRGRATVWLHPSCRDGVPELAGVELAPMD